MKTAEDFLDGQILLIDKPLNWTSFQVVNHIKWSIRNQFKLKKIKVGHAGTLDPLATGLLIVCTGKFTKKISGIQGQTKEYTGEFTLGATTPSYDLETEIDKTFPIGHITRESILETTNHFIGAISQIPPIFSAIKKDGKRLYELARKGETAKIEPRTITIERFDITDFNLPKVSFLVRCSKGTYIRSLAHDFGRKLDSGAHLSALRRTKIGAYSVSNALTPEQFKEELIGD